MWKNGFLPVLIKRGILVVIRTFIEQIINSSTYPNFKLSSLIKCKRSILLFKQDKRIFTYSPNRQHTGCAKAGKIQVVERECMRAKLLPLLFTFQANTKSQEIANYLIFHT